jgi:formate transporter
VFKSSGDISRVFALAILADAFIAFGAIFFTVVTYDLGSMVVGLMCLIGGLVFCLGLILLVVVVGAELDQLAGSINLDNLTLHGFIV